MFLGRKRIKRFRPTIPTVRIAAATLVVGALLIGAGPSASANKHEAARWVKHVWHWSGGISNGVRARLAQASGDIVASSGVAPAATVFASPLIDNVQMNGDSDPPLPQDEPSIAESLDDPMNAVAASNDYTGDGLWIGYTTDGGQTWISQWKDPKFSFDGVAASRRTRRSPTASATTRSTSRRCVTSRRRRRPRSRCGSRSTAARRGPRRSSPRSW